jgi:hypothetical protein
MKITLFLVAMILTTNISYTNEGTDIDLQAGYSEGPTTMESLRSDDEWIHWVLEMFGYDMDDDAFEELIEHLQTIRNNPFFLGNVTADQLRDLIFLDEFEIRKILEWVHGSWSEDKTWFSGTEQRFIEAEILNSHLAHLLSEFVRFANPIQPGDTQDFGLAAENNVDYNQKSENDMDSPARHDFEADSTAKTEVIVEISTGSEASDSNSGRGSGSGSFHKIRPSGLIHLSRDLTSELRVRTEIRAARPIQFANGYNGHYLGSPLRYQERIEIGHPRFSAHITRAKQNGEAMKWPSDLGFHTGHLRLTDIMGLEVLAGDYSIRYGSGLVFGSGGMRQGVRSGGVNTSIGTRVRPYRSGASGPFMRGLVAGGVVRGADVRVFGSERRLAATPFFGDGAVLVQEDGDGPGGADCAPTGAVAGLGCGGKGLLPVGYFMPGWGVPRRTQSEVSRYANLRLRSLGVTAGGRRSFGGFTAGVGMALVGNWFNDNVVARPDRWSSSDFEGRRLWQWSVATELKGRNWFFTGEVAGSGSGGVGVVYSIRWSDRPLEAGVLGRMLPADFHTVFGQAPGAWSGAANEHGFGAWLQWRGDAGFRVRMYADGYRSPGARYGSDVGVWGRERGAAVDWRRGRRLSAGVEVYQRSDLYPAVVNDVSGREYRVRLERERGTLRGWFRVEPGGGWMAQSRLEVQSWEGQVPAEAETDAFSLIFTATHPASLMISSHQALGYGWTQTLRYRTRMLETILQHTIFDTENHNSRVYAFEYDLAGQLRVPSWSGQGQRTNLVIQYTSLNRVLVLRVKTGRTFYSDRFEVGTGADATQGPVRNDLAAQIILNL